MSLDDFDHAPEVMSEPSASASTSETTLGLSDKARFVEERRRSFEQYAWQSIGFFLVVEGVLVGLAVAPARGSGGQLALSVTGMVGAVVFAQLY